MMSAGGSKGGKAAPVKVIVNVYDLHPNTDWAYSLGFGIHHSGVEVLGQEYSFYGGESSGTGVMATPPRTIQPPAKYRESIEFGEINMTSAEFQTVIKNISAEWPANSYHITDRNCNMFCNELCMRLLKKPLPGWINRAAVMGGPIVRRVMANNAGPPPAAAPVSGSSTAAFSGKGYTLSSSSSSTASKATSASTTTSSSKAKTTTASTSVATPSASKSSVTVDSGQETTTLQVRLLDGSRAVHTFNLTHTVNDVRALLDAEHPAGRAYSLYTAYPRAPLSDGRKTLAQANLRHAAIVQEAS